MINLLMKRIVLIALTIFPFLSFAQRTWTPVKSIPGYEYNGLNVDSILKVPTDTVHNKLYGSIVFLNHNTYFKDSTAWIAITVDLSGYHKAVHYDSVFLGLIAQSGYNKVSWDAKMDSVRVKNWVAWNYVNLSTSISINGTSYDLSTNRSWTVGDLRASNNLADVTNIVTARSNLNVFSKADSTAGGFYPYSTNPLGYLTSASIASKLDKSDTAAMLSPYAKQNMLNNSLWNTVAAKMDSTRVKNWSNWTFQPLGSYALQATTITINGIAFDLSTNRSWTINSMVYPGAGIAVSTGSAWGTSITDNSSNWNTVVAKMDSVRVKNWGNWTFQPLGSYLTSNQTITLSGIVTGSGATAITTSIAAGAITNTMLANGAVANLSGTNTGDNAVNSLYSGLVTNANHTGDATGATVLTLVTVNSNIGTFNNVTVNAKGLVTSASNTSYEVPLTFSTGLTRIGNTITNNITQYTDALARAAISVSGSLSYNSTTGVISYTTPTIPAQVALTAGSNISITGTYPNLTIANTYSYSLPGTVVQTSGSYSDPSWLTISATKVGLSNVTNNAQWYSGNHPTTVSGYGITDIATSIGLSGYVTTTNFNAAINGTGGTIPKFVSANAIGNSQITDDGQTLKYTAAGTYNTIFALYSAAGSGGIAVRNWGIQSNYTVYGDFAIMQSNAKDGNPFSAGTAALGTIVTGFNVTTA